MAGIYIHIPFCRQACSYCNFHFSTNLARKAEMLEAIGKEIEQRKSYLHGESISTIYFGGGTPSVLTSDELNKLFELIYASFSVEEKPEITLEANPDDLDQKKLKELKTTPINRLSIGVQSFFDKDLKFMNRIHSADEAKKSIYYAQDIGFEQLSIDLIFGSPTCTDRMWEENLSRFFEFKLSHLSAYSLTVEEKTALAHRIKKEADLEINDEQNYRHYTMLQRILPDNQFEQYELSNYCRNKQYSRHNTAYWKREKYLGIGPSAHSFDGESRQWNVSNNGLYMKAVMGRGTYFKKEELTEIDRYHEYLITALRTKWGVSIKFMKEAFSAKTNAHFKAKLESLDQRDIAFSGDQLRIKPSMLFSSDQVVRHLMFD